MKSVLQANLKEGEYKMKYCPYCGAEIVNGAVSFCSECGGSLTEVSPKKEKKKTVCREKQKKEKRAKVKQPPSDEIQTESDDSDYDGYYDDIVPADTANAEKQGFDKDVIKKIILLAAGVAVVIGLCVVLLYFL